MPPGIPDLAIYGPLGVMLGISVWLNWWLLVKLFDTYEKRISEKDEVLDKITEPLKAIENQGKEIAIATKERGDKTHELLELIFKKI